LSFAAWAFLTFRPFLSFPRWCWWFCGRVSGCVWGCGECGCGVSAESDVYSRIWSSLSLEISILQSFNRNKCNAHYPLTSLRGSRSSTSSTVDVVVCTLRGKALLSLSWRARLIARWIADPRPWIVSSSNLKRDDIKIVQLIALGPDCTSLRPRSTSILEGQWIWIKFYMQIAHIKSNRRAQKSG